MKKYEAFIKLGKYVVVEAPTEEEAQIQVSTHVWQINGTIPFEIKLNEITDTALPRPITQTCPRCHVLRLKTAFGPGFVKCPDCLKFLPSASEIVDEEVSSG